MKTEGRRLHKVWLALAGLLLLSLAVAAACLLSGLGLGGALCFLSNSFLEPDISLPELKDLALDRPEVATEHNAYACFLSASASFRPPRNDGLVAGYLDGKPGDDAAVRDTIAGNKTLLEEIERGLERRVCLAPEIRDFGAPIPHLCSWRKIGQLLAIKARHDRMAGKPAEAAGACISLLRFSDMIQNEAEGSIHYLVGLGVLELGLAQARDLARDKETPPEELARLSKALAGLGPFARGLVRASKAEYRLMADMVDRMRDGKFTPSQSPGFGGALLRTFGMPGHLLQPNRTKFIFAQFFRHTIRNAPLNFADREPYAPEETSDGPACENKAVARPNQMGRFMVELLIPSDERLFERKCRAECCVAASRLIVACNAFRKKEGRLPGDLQSLAPAYLPSVPADPYDGKPFRFLPAKGMVYSVGKDLKDSGGSARLAAQDGDDTPQAKPWNGEDVVFEVGEAIEGEN